MMTFSAQWRKVGALPMPVVRYTRPVASDLGSLHNGKVDRSEKSLHHTLRNMREVHVDEVDLSSISQLSQRRGAHVRGTPAYGLGPGQFVVACDASRCPAEQPDLECLATLVQFSGTLR